MPCLMLQHHDCRPGNDRGLSCPCVIFSRITQAHWSVLTPAAPAAPTPPRSAPLAVAPRLSASAAPPALSAAYRSPSPALSAATAAPVPPPVRPAAVKEESELAVSELRSGEYVASPLSQSLHVAPTLQVGGRLRSAIQTQGSRHAKIECWRLVRYRVASLLMQVVASRPWPQKP